ncbi:radical SAM protein [Patescibacteria group bacterium]|nr:radical SAM protein [Patescibacteria group bacterium]
MCTRYIEGVGYDAPRVELDPNHVELITNRYRQTLKNVDIISYGEPLVHPKFSEIVEIIARNISHNPGYTITLVTNGSNLHEHQGILKHPGTLAFSIDAPDKPLYEKIRKGLSYDRLIENIYLAAAAQAILPGRRLAINMVIFEWTVNRIYAMAAFAKNMGIETLALLLGGCSEQSEFVRDQAVARGDPRVLEQVAMARRDFPGVCIIDYVTDPRGPVGHCRRPWSEIVVTNDGRVLPCCVMKTAPFGTCADPADWTGPKWNRLRDELYTRNILSSEFQTCKTCVWL